MQKCSIGTQNTLLERIEQNYEDFKTTVVQLDGDCVFELAPMIAAVKDVHFYMTTHDWADMDQTEFLLKFENPLRLLADCWEEESEDRGAGFGKMLDRIVSDDYEDFTESYITVSRANELRDKYGDDISIEGAIISEIVELGRRFLDIESEIKSKI